MKKTLIAAAALTAAAGAMADVMVTGTIDATLRMSDNGAAKTTQVGRDGSGTTGVIFKVSEDLGDGLKAVGLYEHDFNFQSGGTQRADGASNGNAASNDGTGERFVGLEGGFGSIKLGSPNAPSLAIQSGLRGAPFGTKDGGRGSAGGVHSAGLPGGTAMFGKNLTRYDGSILYSTPSFSGFSAQVDYVPATEKNGVAGTGVPNFTGTAGDKVGAITDIGLFYKAGAINAGIAFYSQGEVETGGAVTSVKEDLVNLGIHYNFGFATLGLGYHAYSKDGKDENSGFNLIAAVPLSEQLTLGVNYQSLMDDRTGVTNANTNDATQVAVGLNYALSKNTSIYARYVSLSPDKTNAETVTTTLAGLRVNF